MPGVFRRRWFPRLRHSGAPGRIDATLALTGVSTTAQAGTLSQNINSNKLLGGLQATAQVGTPGKSAAFTLTGVEATTQIGSSAEVGTVNLVGQQATAQVGSTARLIDSNLNLAGVAASSARGALAGDHPAVFLSGTHATTAAGQIVGSAPIFALVGVEATTHVTVPTANRTLFVLGQEAVAQVNADALNLFKNVHLSGVSARAQAFFLSGLGAGGGGGGAAGLNGAGQRGHDGAGTGFGGQGGDADNHVVAGAVNPGDSGASGTELSLSVGSGSGGAGASFDGTPGLLTYNYNGTIFISYQSSITSAPVFITRSTVDNGPPFIIPADWTSTNVISLTGPGCATPGNVTIISNLVGYIAGQSVPFHCGAYCSGVATTWDTHSASCGALSPPLSGGKGGDGGLYGGGGAGGTGGGGGLGGDGVIYLQYVSTQNGTTKTVTLHATDNPSHTFTMPADWSNANLVYLSGSGGNGDSGSPSQGGNGGAAGGVTAAHGALVFAPGDVVNFFVSPGGSGMPTIFGPYAARSGRNGDSGTPSGIDVTDLYIYVLPGTGDSISFPSTEPGFGFGIGGDGGSMWGIEYSGSDLNPFSVEATAEIGAFSGTGFPSDRVFVIAGRNQQVLPPGTAMYPTSETVNLGSNPYIIASSQFYTIGQVSWGSVVRIQGVDWQLVDPFSHIIEILTLPSAGTPIELIFFRWDIGVTAGFEVTSYPVQFSFIDTTIIAEKIPLVGQFFTVNFVRDRPLTNPTTFFAIYPLIVDDVWEFHAQYDAPNGFQTYRPAGYRVVDLALSRIFEWDGAVWHPSTVLATGTKFYVKALRGVYILEGSAILPVFEAGDPADLSYPQALTYPNYGEGIGKNLLVDAFSANAAVDFPAAYEVAISPGDFDPWATD